jgi:hypothetical protein
MHLGWDRARGGASSSPGAASLRRRAHRRRPRLGLRHLRRYPASRVSSTAQAARDRHAAHALARLVPTVAKTRLLAVLAAGVVATCLLGVKADRYRRRRCHRRRAPRPTADARRRLSVWLPVAAVTTDAALGRLFLTFLRVGAVLYGSGYVLAAFLHGELVGRVGWITSKKLDAVSIGQPRPVLSSRPRPSSATSPPALGAPLLATIGIFLPSFLFVALLRRLVGWMRASATLGLVLDGVNAGAVGLMAGVIAQLTAAAGRPPARPTRPRAVTTARSAGCGSCAATGCSTPGWSPASTTICGGGGRGVRDADGGGESRQSDSLMVPV